MENNKPGQGTYSMANDYEERSMVANREPTTTPGIADGYSIAHPYTAAAQKQIEAISTQKKKNSIKELPQLTQ